MQDIIEKLNSGKYNSIWVISQLWPNMKRSSAIASYRNKLKNINGRKFNDDELKKLEIILK